MVHLQIYLCSFLFFIIAVNFIFKSKSNLIWLYSLSLPWSYCCPFVTRVLLSTLISLSLFPLFCLCLRLPFRKFFLVLFLILFFFSWYVISNTNYAVLVPLSWFLFFNKLLTHNLLLRRIIKFLCLVLIGFVTSSSSVLIYLWNIISFLKIKIINLLIFLLYPYFISKLFYF